MNPSSISAILSKWTGQEDLSNIETSVLEACVNENAFSPSLQLLLAKKYALEQSDKYTSQLQIASSYFPSALQLHLWLSNEESDTKTAPIEAKLNTLISEQLAQFNESVEADQLEFEKEAPQIVKDYFGAQGI